MGSTLVRGASSAFVIRVAGTAIALGVQVLLARVLGAGRYGDYIYALTWMYFLALVGKFGIDTASLRFIPEYQGQAEWGLLRGFIRFSRWASWGLSMVMALILAGAAALFGGRMGSSLSSAFLVAALFLPVFVFLQVRAAGLRAFKQISLAQAPQEIVRPVLLGLGVLLFAPVFGRVPTAAEAMAFHLGAAAVALVLIVWFFRRFIPGSVRGTPPRSQGRNWLEVSFSLLLISGFLLVLSHTDVLMIGAFIDTRTAGIYAAASQLATLASFGLIAINSIAAPMISELYHTDRRGELQRILKTAAKAILVISLPIAVGLVAGGRWALSFFGAEFPAGYPALVILTAGQVINSLAGPVGFLMTMTRYHAQMLWIMGPVVFLNILLNAILIPLFGIWGAAIATALMTVSWNLAMLIFVSRKIGVNPAVFPLGK